MIYRKFVVWEYWSYHDHELYLDLSILLSFHYHYLKNLKYLNAFRLGNEGWEVVHCYYLSKNIVFQRKNKKVQLFSLILLHTHFQGKEVEWEVSFYNWKTFLIMSNKFLYFFVYELMYMLFGNNNLVWKLQLRYVGLLVGFSISSSNVYCCCEVSIRSMLEEEDSNIWVGSLIIWCKPNCDEIFSIALPSVLVMSFLQQLLDFALKSPRSTTRNGYSNYCSLNCRLKIKLKIFFKRFK